MYLKKSLKIHFIGIGGAGVSGLAAIAHQHQFRVTGSDATPSATLDRLSGMGIQTWAPHDSSRLSGSEQLVVISSAIRKDNPELVLLRDRRIPVVTRGEFLAELMRIKHGIAVAGTHGKTTTTSMVGAALLFGGVDPSIYVGGQVSYLQGNVRVGEGEFFVAETDESDGSFLKVSPSIAVVTNVDDDHCEHYGGRQNLDTAFRQFMQKVPFYGCVVACADDPGVASLLGGIDRRIIKYGISAEGLDIKASDLSVKEHRQHFWVSAKDGSSCPVAINSIGRHNVLNALAAIAVGLEVGIPLEKVVYGLQQFAGVDRRFQLKGYMDGIPVYDDYAHHPTEIAATISAAKSLFVDQSIAVVFQPHRFTRTRDCLDSFGKCFSGVDCLFLTPIYSAGEQPIAGIDSEAIADRVTGVNKVAVIESFNQIQQELQSRRDRVRVVLVMGAGTITNFSRALVS